MKARLIIFTKLVFVSLILKAQTTYLKGKLDVSDAAISSIKIVLYDNNYRDTAFLDTTLSFHFKNIPHGVYNILVDANYTLTGHQNLLVTDILVNDGALINMFTIKLSGTKTCGCGAIVLGRKDTVEYYKTGEMYGSGQYKITKKYYAKYKSKLYAYRKMGLWKYFYKSGKLLRKSIYDNDNIISFEEFYENGNKKMLGYYDNCKSKVWEYYSENGGIVFAVDFSMRLTTKINYKYLKGYMDNFEMMEDL